MYLVEVDVVDTQPLQTRLTAREDVLAREAPRRSGPRPSGNAPSWRERRLPRGCPSGRGHDLLGGALLVDVGGVYEVAAGIEEAGDHGPGPLLVQLAPEGHAPEAKP